MANKKNLYFKSVDFSFWQLCGTIIRFISYKCDLWPKLTHSELHTAEFGQNLANFFVFDLMVFCSYHLLRGHISIWYHYIFLKFIFVISITFLKWGFFEWTPSIFSDVLKQKKFQEWKSTKIGSKLPKSLDIDWYSVFNCFANIQIYPKIELGALRTYYILIPI